MTLNRERKYRFTGIRLPSLDKVPSYDELVKLFRTAASHSSGRAELPIYFSGIAYFLVVEPGRRKDDVERSWTLTQGASGNRAALWTHITSDVAVIHNMLVCAIGAESSLDKLNTYASAVSETAIAPGQVSSEATLHGELSNLPIDSLVQNIANNRTSGRLAIRTQNNISNVFFVEGTPIQCKHRGMAGEEALVEVLMLREGTFEFIPKVEKLERNIHRSIQVLLMEAAALSDYSNYLLKNGVDLDSYVQSRATTREEYDRMLENLVPVDLNLQARVCYLCVEGIKVVELIRTIVPQRALWAPILFNLVKSNLITVIEEPNPAKQMINAKVREGYFTFRQSMVRPEYGLFSYPAFQFFLEDENIRFNAYKRPYSIALLRFGLRSGSGAIDPLNQQDITTLLGAITKTLRSVDKVCHYEVFDFALLLPETDESGMRFLETRLREAISQVLLDGVLDQSKLVMALGPATMSMETQGKDLLGIASSKRSKDLLAQARSLVNQD